MIKHIFHTFSAIFFSLIWKKIEFEQFWKWNESGFRPLLCTYRLNWDRRTFWWWLGEWDDTVLQTQDSKFKPWRSEAEFYEWMGKKHFWFLQTAGTRKRTPNSSVKCSAANHYTRAPRPKQLWPNTWFRMYSWRPFWNDVIKRGWRALSRIIATIKSICPPCINMSQ